MKVFIVSVLFISVVGGESFTGFGVRRTLNRKFEAPDVIASQQFEATDVVVSARTVSDVIPDVPVLSEWDDKYSDLNRRHIIISGRDRPERIESFNEESEVASLLQKSCRRCMVAGNMACVANMCSLTNMLVPVERQVRPASFVTGVSMHGDLLCSWCKSSGDVTCKKKFCEDPEREKNVENSGVECMQGICRWQKETVVSAGFNNNYNGWWQPNNLILVFDQFTRNLASAYRDVYMATSRAIDVLG